MSRPYRPAPRLWSVVAALLMVLVLTPIGVWALFQANRVQDGIPHIGEVFLSGELHKTELNKLDPQPIYAKGGEGAILCGVRGDDTLLASTGSGTEPDSWTKVFDVVAGRDANYVIRCSGENGMVFAVGDTDEDRAMLASYSNYNLIAAASLMLSAVLAVYAIVGAILYARSRKIDGTHVLAQARAYPFPGTGPAPWRG